MQTPGMLRPFNVRSAYIHASFACGSYKCTLVLEVVDKTALQIQRRFCHRRNLGARKHASIPSGSLIIVPVTIIHIIILMEGSDAHFLLNRR